MLHFSILFMTALTMTSAPDHLIKLVGHNNEPLPYYPVTMIIDDQPVSAETLSDGQLLLETDKVIINKVPFTLDKEQETIVISEGIDEPSAIAEQQSETFIQMIDQHNKPLPSQPLLLDGEKIITDEKGQLTLELTPGDHELACEEQHLMIEAGEERYFMIQMESRQPAASVRPSEEIPAQRRAPETKPAAALVIQKPIQKPAVKPIPTPQPSIPHPDPHQHKTSKQRTEKIVTKKAETQKEHKTTSQKPDEIHANKEKIAEVAQTKQNQPKTDERPYEATQKAIKKTPIRKISAKPQLPVTEPQVDPRPRVSTEEIVSPKSSRAKKNESAQLPQTGEHDITKLLSSIFAISGTILLIYSRRPFRT